MRVLGIDLGSTTGWARWLDDDPGLAQWGHWTLKGDHQQRTIELLDNLDRAVTGQGRPDVIIYEDVTFVVSHAQITLWSSLRAALYIVAWKHDIPIRGVPVGTLKKWATGNGRSSKKVMVNYAEKALAEAEYEGTPTHDEADAIHLARWGAEHGMKGDQR